MNKRTHPQGGGCRDLVMGTGTHGIAYKILHQTHWGTRWVFAVTLSCDTLHAALCNSSMKEPQRERTELGSMLLSHPLSPVSLQDPTEGLPLLLTDQLWIPSRPPAPKPSPRTHFQSEGRREGKLSRGRSPQPGDHGAWCISLLQGQVPARAALTKEGTQR